MSQPFQPPNPTMSGQKSQCLNCLKSHPSFRQCPGRSLNVSMSQSHPSRSGFGAQLCPGRSLRHLRHLRASCPGIRASEPNYASRPGQKSQCLNVSKPSQPPSFGAQLCLASPTMPRELCPGRSLNVSTSQSHPSLRALPNHYSGFGASRAQLCLASPTMPREPNYASRVQLCLASPTMPPEPNYAFRAELCLRRTVCKHFAAPQIPRPTTLSPQNRQPFETHDSRACVETSPVANTE